MTLASDRPPCPCPEGGQREAQRTLRVGVSGATGRVSRERSSRIGAVLAQSSRDTSPPQRERNLLFEQNRSALVKRYVRSGTKYYVLGPPARVKRIRWLFVFAYLETGKRFRQGRGVPPPVVYSFFSQSRDGCEKGGGAAHAFESRTNLAPPPMRKTIMHAS